ncbi:MAG: ACT domain-containing protein [Promethearchaeota archaeon]
MVMQITVFLPNRAGELMKVTKLLADEGIDIRALTVSETADFGLLRLIVDKPEQCLKALRSGNFLADTTEILAVSMKDKPGGLHEVASILGENGVNIEYLYAFTHADEAILLVCPTDAAKAVEVLDRHNVKVFSPEEIYGL